MREVVAISVLTNGARRKKLERCLSSLLTNCRYRPLKMCVFDNGSTDDTWEWLSGFPSHYGVELVRERSESDLGCAAGTNRACAMTLDCRYAMHVESDFVHLSPEMSGEGYMWLADAVSFMNEGRCDYLYLRRMVDEDEVKAHWWAQWMPKTRTFGRYMMCPGFWWSNNPHLRSNEAVYRNGSLPLDELKDGSKGTPGWSRPELEAGKPGRTWIHKWGVFVHDRDGVPAYSGCGGFERVGASTCKYGLFVGPRSGFCSRCDKEAGIEDMPRQVGNV